jgi:hypothetical protein
MTIDMKIENELSVARLRDIVQDTHLNFLVGAGTPSALFSPLGDIEDVLTQLDTEVVPHDGVRTVARASVYAYFFDNVLVRNNDLLAGTSNAPAVLSSYQEFLRTIHRILLRRRSTLLNKQANIFTTNVDLTFEVALERLGIEVNDGFSGKITPQFDTTNFGSVRFRKSSRYENLSEVPTFNVFKIHGSIGWRTLQTEVPERLPSIAFDTGLGLVKDVSGCLASARPFLQPIGQGTGETPITELIASAAPSDVAVNETIFDFMTAYDQLAIVNPNKTKFQTTVMNQTYYELLRIFANELEKENSTLFVLGFSFRDEHLRQMVVRAAGGNPTLQILVFCFTRADKTAVEKLIPPSLVKNGNISYVIPLEDDEDGTTHHLDLDAVTTTYFAPLVPELKERRIPAFDLSITLEDGRVTAAANEN